MNLTSNKKRKKIKIAKSAIFSGEKNKLAGLIYSYQ